MNNNSHVKRSKILTIFFSMSLALVLLFNQLPSPFFTPALATSGVGLQTVGDFISLGANTVREVQNSIRVAGEEARSTLEEFNSHLNSLIETLNRTYQDNLNITLNSLDTTTRNKLLELQEVIEQVNQLIKEDISLTSLETQKIIKKASQEIQRTTQQLEESFKTIIVVGGETVAYVIDRSVYNAILVISLVMLALGILLFVWLLFTQTIPIGIIRYLVFSLFTLYIGLFGSLVLVPPVRTYAMAYTGIGLQERLKKVAAKPRILEVIPEAITIGEIKELAIWGSNLLEQGKSPTVKIADRTVEIVAISDTQIAVKVDKLDISPGRKTLELQYSDMELRYVVEFKAPPRILQPPDLVLRNLLIRPRSPIQRRNVQATIFIENRGEASAENFKIQWRPRARDAATAQSINVPVLEGGQSKTYKFNYAYPAPGSFDTVAIVDSSNRISEQNEANNSKALPINVQVAKARVSVTFTEITVNDDADPAGSGEIWLNFNISGVTGRWPDSGTRSVDSGGTVSINKRFEKVLTEGEKLTVFVNGTDEDNPGFPTFDDHDPLGKVSKIYSSSQRWGKGSHSIKSTCDDGCYTIHYVIGVNWLN